MKDAYMAFMLDDIAWINRITYYKEECGAQVLASEVWLIMLLAWGYVEQPVNYQMTETWCQKFVAFDTVLGGVRIGGFQVRDK